MKLAHVITGTNIGGAERMLQKVRRQLTQRGFEQLIVSIAPLGPVGIAMQQEGADIISLGAAPRLLDLPKLWRLRSILREFAPALVQSWMYHADLLSTWAVAGLHPKPPLLWNLRGSVREFGDYGLSTAAVVRLCALLSHRPEGILVNSSAGMHSHRRLGYHANWIYIANGFEIDQFHPDATARLRLRSELNLPPNTPLVAVVARAHPMKDHANFVRAWAEVVAENPSARALLVGVKADNELIQAAMAAAGQPKGLIFVGPRSDMAQVLAGLDLLCVSSASGEGFPNVVGEAMACGVPCVVTDVGDAAAIVDTTGLSVPVRSSALLAQAIKALLNEPAAAKTQRSQACRQRIVDHFSIDIIGEHYERTYRTVLGLSPKSTLPDSFIVSNTNKESS